MIEAGDIENAIVRKPVKSESAFRTISEVSEDLDVPQHVLRFWESKFPQIKPLKRGGGRRYYRPEDLNLLRHIRDLLYKDGYTIRGVQKLLRDQSRGQSNGGAKSAEVPMVAEDARGEAVALPPVAEAPIPVEIVEEPVVQPQLNLDVAPQAIEEVDVRSELKSLLAELEELRSLLSQARPG